MTEPAAFFCYHAVLSSPNQAFSMYNSTNDNDIQPIGPQEKNRRFIGSLFLMRQLLYRGVLRLNPVADRELRFMRKCQWYTKEQVLAIQRRRLKTILEYAYLHGICLAL